MQIVISERLRPFSHLPGTSLILPGPGYQIEIFPCLIRVYQLKTSIPILILELHLELQGPIGQFTIFQDLERGCICVGGKTKKGWMRYQLIGSKDLQGLRFYVEKAPDDGFSLFVGQKHYLLQDKEHCDFFNSIPFDPYQAPLCDRLSLGNHKAQDWELIKRRLSFKEIFPIWHRLGQLIPPHLSDSKEGSLSLLEECRKELFERNMPEKSKQKWMNLFLAGFHHLLVPRIQDDHYQGIIPSHSSVLCGISPLVLLSQGANLIRQFFIRKEEERIFLLPHLLPDLPCGRLIHVSLNGGIKVSIEWTKKTIRRVMITSESEVRLNLKFPSNVKSYRIRSDLKETEERRECSSPLYVENQRQYFMDNFR